MKIYLQAESIESIELLNPEIIEEAITGKPAHVILFNDEIHTFDEVINQIIKAIKCSHQKAESLTFEVHNNGKTCVYIGGMSKCLKVTAVLEEIQLMTEIQM
ncbi:MAG: ATP-dependent Clp protease adaptor ClpS [Bacteroidetes bacterium]|nr:ATP-dependent Clp protease adaptor ClpS [Bacteroidota bacterium]